MRKINVCLLQNILTYYSLSLCSKNENILLLVRTRIQLCTVLCWLNHIIRNKRVRCIMLKVLIFFIKKIYFKTDLNNMTLNKINDILWNNLSQKIYLINVIISYYLWQNIPKFYTWSSGLVFLYCIVLSGPYHISNYNNNLSRLSGKNYVKIYNMMGTGNECGREPGYERSK